MKYWDRHEPAAPRQAKGGIKSRSRRGSFGHRWWARRWIETLESFPIGPRLQRGRRYARQGQVLYVEVDHGRVTAEVQGTRKRPYLVEIRMRTLSKASWRKACAALSSRAAYGAKLLAGEIPEEIEGVLAGAGVSLFPERQADLKTSCSCPDWSNPCKHVAAVYYLLAEEFERDPFLIFKLRGMERPELVRMLAGAPPSASPPMPAPTSDPLPVDPEPFWQGGNLPPDILGDASAPALHAALLRQFGDFPFWRGERPLLELLEPVYRRASKRGMILYQAGMDADGEAKAHPAGRPPEGQDRSPGSRKGRRR